MRKLKITELNRLSVDEFKKAEKLPLVVVLDEVRSLHNIGSVFVIILAALLFKQRFKINEFNFH